MLTGRVYFGDRGRRLRFSQYLRKRAARTRRRWNWPSVAANAPPTTSQQGAADDRRGNPQTGLLMESPMATAQSDKEAKLRICAFLDRKTAKVKPA